MKFVISTQEFVFLVNKCLNVVGTKGTSPILSNILIEAFNDELILSATDLTVGVRCYTEAKILEEGATTLPAKKLGQLVRELTSINLEFSTNEKEITEILAGSSRFKLLGMHRKDFPNLPSMSDAIQIKASQSELKDMLHRTAFAVSREDNRYVLTGVNMHIANGIASFVGTDGKRLSRCHMPVNLDKSFTGSYIIPIKAVEEIVKNLNDEGDAVISLLPDKIGIEASQTMIVTKLLSGEYPDVTRIIPEQMEISVALHREELMTLLRQVALFVSDMQHSVRLSFTPGELRLSANTMDIGEGKVSMPVNYHGQRMDIAFNPNFFLDILRHCNSEAVQMGVTDAYNPGIITDAEQAVKLSTARSLFVLMPLRLNEE